MPQYCNIYYCLKRKEEKPDAYVRQLLDYGFWDSFSIPYRKEEILKGEYGKPLSTREGIYFNISHGHRIVALACAEVPVGIDVESPRRVTENAMKRSCSDREWEWILSSGNQQEDFLRLWTLKESYVKMTGTGLRMAPGEIEFRMQPMERVKEENGITVQEISHRKGFFLQYKLEEGYLALCLENKKEDWGKEKVYLKKMSFPV